MSPQESDEDKSDYNLVVDEVSLGSSFPCPRHRARRGEGFLGRGHRRSELLSPLYDMAGRGTTWVQEEWGTPGYLIRTVGETETQRRLGMVSSTGFHPWLAETPASLASVSPICPAGKVRQGPYVAVAHRVGQTHFRLRHWDVSSVSPRWSQVPRLEADMGRVQTRSVSSLTSPLLNATS
jgi:hypothetical protein